MVEGSPPVCKLAPVVHHATFELFNAVQFIATSLVETRHIIFAIAVAPAFVVEGCPDIMVITAEITAGQVVGLTAMAFLDMMKGTTSVAVQSLQEITIWTKGPAVVAKEEYLTIRL